MSETNVNSDLLKCENELYTKDSLNKSLLITKKAQKNAISYQLTENPIKTEKISSTVLSKAKEFLEKSKTNESIGEKCDLIDENTDETEDNGKQMIEMNLMLFQNKQHLNKDNSSDEETHSSDSSDSSSDESEEDTTESDKESSNEEKGSEVKQ